MKYIILTLLLALAQNAAYATSCTDPYSCVPTKNDKEICQAYLTDVTGAKSDNDQLDIRAACRLNYGLSCIQVVSEHLNKKDFNSMLDIAKACGGNYSEQCIDTLIGASWTRNWNTVLDFTRACRQNFGDRCVKLAIKEGRSVDHWSLRSYAKSCQVYNGGLNRN